MDADLQSTLAENGIEVATSSPDKLKRLISQHIKVHAELVKADGLVPQKAGKRRKLLFKCSWLRPAVLDWKKDLGVQDTTAPFPLRLNLLNRLSKQRLKPLNRLKQLVPVPQARRPRHRPRPHRMAFVTGVANDPGALKIKWLWLNHRWRAASGVCHGLLHFGKA